MALTLEQKINENNAQSTRFGGNRQPTASLATSATPTQVQRTGFSVDIPDSIPSSSLVDGGSYSDLFAKRSQMESSQLATQQFDQDLSNLTTRINSPFAGSPISNPDEFINRLLLNRPTDTQTQLDETRQSGADSARDFSSEYRQAGDSARKEFGVVGLQESLAETRNRIAERTTNLRQTLRDFETNAERRGVAREFVQGEKQKIQADAAAELADLAIIESAQLGNLQQAQADIDRVLNEKIQAFELENMAIEQEIKRLESIDTRESNIRSEQLQVALNERQRREEKLISDEKQRLEYMSVAAANGADSITLDAIRNSSSVGEAALLAGPWIGRLERQVKQSQLYTSSLQQQKLLKEISDTSGDLPTDVIEQDGNKLLINTQTGEIIKNFGSGDVSMSEITQAQTAHTINTIDGLFDHRGKDRAVGAYSLSRWTPVKVDKADYLQFIGTVDQLTKDLTKEKLAEAKAQGITFGALSEKELGLIADSATKINNWRVTDETGKTQFFEIDEKSFNAELDIINNFKKLNAVLEGADPASVGVLEMNGGNGIEYWTLNSDGNYVKIR